MTMRYNTGTTSKAGRKGAGNTDETLTTHSVRGAMKAMAILSSADSTQQLSLFDPTDYIDNRPAPEIIAARHGFALAFHEDADELPDRRWYAVQDWIKGIAQTDNPRAFWSEMKKRLKKGGIELSTSCLQFPYRAANGKTYKIDHAQADTLYQIVQRMDANTPLRDEPLPFDEWEVGDDA